MSRIKEEKTFRKHVAFRVMVVAAIVLALGVSVFAAAIGAAWFQAFFEEQNEAGMTAEQLALIEQNSILIDQSRTVNGYMDWHEVEDQVQTEVRTQLEALDFPGYLLADLTDEEILACQGAGDVYVETEEIAFNDGVQVTESDGYVTYTHTEHPVKELLVTHVAIRPADESKPWIVIHHFLWRQNPGYRGTEAIQIWPGYMKNDGWNKGTRMSGRVLYDRDGITYASPYHSLEEETYTASGFFGSYENTDITAAFSIPVRSENFRGYVFYDLEMAEEGWLLNSWCNYFRQVLPNYPLQTAESFSKSGFSIGRNDFEKRQSQLQLWWDEIEGPFEPDK